MAKRRATTPDLPGIDRGIAPLEQIAVAYADVRDRRAELTREEVDLKGQALALMHKFNKTVYKRDGIEIRLEPGEETVKVKITKKKGEGDDD